ncbi:hypothetical protein C7M84_002280 [Penaeus vannamei]|uniref:Chitin-binding type-4 domain-containing protein n=1 Tax=Penaeus vannamei TaxID=6689 RepID=A0A3R7PPZ3_PENVA|nr:hypothetical protein C7M84_002280 [Penaeus vannamei]
MVWGREDYWVSPLGLRESAFLQIQYGENDGKCGVCGDNWADPQPRDNEAGGTYGTGLIVANYTKGQELTIEVELTKSHLGYFEFRLCVNNDPSKIITDECLDQNLLEMADGSGTKFYIESYSSLAPPPESSPKQIDI